MNEELGGCFVFVLIVILILGSLWVLYDRNEAYKEGYVQALADIESKRSPRFVRSRQKNGEYIWVDATPGTRQQSPNESQE
jgi:hypothetical protein